VTEPHAIPGDVHAALEAVSVPSYMIDRAGVIRWVNQAAISLVGDVRGRQFTSVVAPEETRRAREHFTRKIIGTEKVTDERVAMLDRHGERIDVEISSVPLVDGHQIVGVFGQFADVGDEPSESPPSHLTPRQSEVLRLLQRGASTEQIARELQLSPETVRNHVRHLLRALGVRTRLEAVAVARRTERYEGASELARQSPYN
jgi:PAS domain S-box-containing protein